MTNWIVIIHMKSGKEHTVTFYDGSKTPKEVIDKLIVQSPEKFLLFHESDDIEAGPIISIHRGSIESIEIRKEETNAEN